MAVDVVYVDGTLGTGANNGNNWDDARQGRAGLQIAFDAVSAVNETIMNVRNNFTWSGVRLDIDVNGGTRATNKWLWVIGCSSITGNPLPIGYHTIWDGDLMAGDLLKIDGCNNVRIDNVSFRRTNGSPSNDLVVIDASPENFGFVFHNCDFQYGYRGIRVPNKFIHSVVLDRCTASNITATTFDLGTIEFGGAVVNCYINNVGGTTGILAGAGVAVTGNLITLGVNGIIATGEGNVLITNNTFIAPTDACVEVAHNDCLATVYNNLLYIDRIGFPNAYALQVTAGSIAYEDYNVTNAEVNGLLTGANSFNGDVADDDWIKIMPADYRLQPGSGCLNTGKPNRLGGYTNIGAWNNRQGSPRKLINV